MHRQLCIAFLCLSMLLTAQKSTVVFDVQGHRGCRGLMPENTIPAFLHAVDLGVTTLELDVVISADGQIVVSHEPWLNPDICLDPEGNPIQEYQHFNLYKMDYQTIEKCDCGSLGNNLFPEQQKMVAHKPLLKDVIKTVLVYCAKQEKPSPFFNVEIKSRLDFVGKYHPSIPEFTEAVVQVLQKVLPNSVFTIQSFDVATLQYLHQNHPEINVAFLVEDDAVRTNVTIDEELKTLGFVPAIYSCWYEMLNAENVSYLQGKGILVIPWTVNETEAMEILMRYGVDGIITDYPNKLLALFNH